MIRIMLQPVNLHPNKLPLTLRLQLLPLHDLELLEEQPQLDSL